MCGIAGFFDGNGDFLARKEDFQHVLQEMTRVLRRRGPDEKGQVLTERCGLAHARLSVIDLETGRQPICCGGIEHPVFIVHNGEIYNLPVLRKRLTERGITFRTRSDAEVLALSYLVFGPSFIRDVDGIFATAIYDERHGILTLFRDAFGVKPLYYTVRDGALVFASEPKGLFCYPGVEATLDATGLNEIFSLGPAHTPGCGVFQGFHEVLPGARLTCSAYGLKQTIFYRMESHPHEDSYEETIEKTRFLVTDAIKRQMVSDVPVCTFLSGGVDSSVVSAVCAGELKKKGEQLAAFSFDFTDNEKFFQANAFQPSQDRPFVEQMRTFLDARHTWLECDVETQAELLNASVDAHDLPCMVDIDSSLLYFCREVSKSYKVVLTGECADEIFGGYPWFHREELLYSNTFPWTTSLNMRKELLSADLLEALQMDRYVENAYQNAVSEVDILPGEDETEANRRRIGYLNIRFFMQTLLNRMDRAGMYSGLEARVPFADRALVSYLFNVPWEMKARGGIVKNLLRQASRGIVPDGILFRQKSPYPKTYHPYYEQLLARRLIDALKDSESPLRPLLNQPALERFLEYPKDCGKPWYGQLMAGPQMIAYLLQVDYFLRKYHVHLAI